MKSEIHSEREFMNKPEVFIVPNLKESIEKLKNIDINDIHSIDDAKWFFTHSQLLTLNEMNLTKEQIEAFLKENVQMEDLFSMEILHEIIHDKIDELVEDGIDLTDKLVTTSISLDKDFNRQIELNLVDDPDAKLGLKNFNDELPEFNQIIESQIKTVCYEMLNDKLDEEELNDFIEQRIDEYKDNPYTLDWLEGFIEGYLSNLD